MNDDLKILELADQILILCPENESFFISNVIEKMDSDELKKEALYEYSDSINKLLIGNGYIKRPINQNIRYILTEKGKLVKSKGGIIKYQKYEKKLLRNNKYYNFGKDYVLHLIAILISIVAIVKSYKEDNEVKKIGVKQTEQEDKFTKEIDSLYSEINKLKKK